MTTSNVKRLLVLSILFFSVSAISENVLRTEVEGETLRFCRYTPDKEIRTVSLSEYCPETKPENERLSAEEIQLRIDLHNSGTSIESEALRAVANEINMDMLNQLSKYKRIVDNCNLDKLSGDEYISEDEELKIRKSCRNMAKAPSWIDEWRYGKKAY
jgi:hypothetical protein